jgi:hypothetical protein
MPMSVPTPSSPLTSQEMLERRDKLAKLAEKSAQLMRELEAQNRQLEQILAELQDREVEPPT